MKLVVLPVKNDLDKDNAFWANLSAFLFQVALAVDLYRRP